MKKFTVLFLVFSLLTLSGEMVAKERQGAQIIVYKLNDQYFRGELIAVKQKTLLLLDAKSNTDVVVNINDVRGIVVVRTPYVVLGLLVGSIVGYLVGAGIAVTEGYEQPGQGYWAVGVTCIGGIIGAITGGIVGIDKKIRIHDRSEKEVQNALEELRKIARVPDYK